MSKPSPIDKSSRSDWYRSRIDHLIAHNEATTAALIQINAALIQLCARIADNARPNEAQMLLGLLPLLSREGEKADDPKVMAQLQKIAETLKKEPEKKA